MKLKNKNNKRLTVIDFFCGGGGFSEGFRRAGFDVIMGVDSWKPAIETHNFNHNLKDKIKDILDFENVEEIEKLPDSDIIIGSPPCQLFSLSNKGGNAEKGEGLQLIKVFLKIVAVKKFKEGSILKAWLMENVPNSRNFVQDQYTFLDLGLEEWAQSQGINPKNVAIYAKNKGEILNSDDYGSAQTRKRFVCGELIETGNFPFPKKTTPTNKVTLRDLFENFPTPSSAAIDKNIIDPNYRSEEIYSKKLRDHFYDTGVYRVQWQKAKDLKERHPYMGKMSFPENMDKPSRTIMATQSASTRESIIYKSNSGRVGDGEYRLPTIREAATIMGFPLNYQFYGDESTKWRQVGNAVSVQLSFALAIKILELLRLARLSPKIIEKDCSLFNYLDNEKAKLFDAPPKRSEKALFRQFPMKSGNMTVDLTNKVEGKVGNWGIVAHSGTGKGFKSIVILPKHQRVAKSILIKYKPELFEEIKNNTLIKEYSVEHFNRMNQKYGYFNDELTHPYYLIDLIGKIIRKHLDADEDIIIYVGDTILSSLKEKIPISQIMSIYMVSVLIYGK